MSKEKKLTIAVVGLGFGNCFSKIYAAHPDVKRVVLVDNIRDRAGYSLNECLRFNPDCVIYERFDDVLNDPEIDAVHVCTGIPNHALLSTAVLNAGKHCACAVPMATSLEEVREVVEAVRRSQKNYMMMETMLYGTPFLYLKDMLGTGELGKIQFMRGVHHQPMDHGVWNTEITRYWQGLPPMHYSCHAVSPLRVAADSRITEVVCFGSGTMSEKLVRNYGNPYPVEDALLRFENGLGAEVVRSLFECSIKQSESYNIYGSKKSFMYEYRNEVWEKVYDEAKYDKASFLTQAVDYPNRYALLPEEIQRFTIRGGDIEPNWKEKLDTAPLMTHEGSHPHLCHEFVRSILEHRKTTIDEELSANIIAAGICAHLSAMNGGRAEKVPSF